MTLKTKQENPDGLHQKFHVSKVSGNDDPNAKYFVLRLDDGADFEYQEASFEALRAFANRIEVVNPKLAQEIREYYFKWQ